MNPWLWPRCQCLIFLIKNSGTRLRAVFFGGSTILRNLKLTNFPKDPRIQWLKIDFDCLPKHCCAQCAAKAQLHNDYQGQKLDKAGVMVDPHIMPPFSCSCILSITMIAERHWTGGK